MSMYAVTRKRLARIQSLLLLGQTPKDKRGKQSNQKQIDISVIQQIKDHIESFPVEKSHYSSQEIQYLDAKLNIKIMFDMFVEKFPLTEIKYNFFQKIFKDHFNFKFGRPQVDTCCNCEELEVKLKSPSLNDTAKHVAAAELLVHKRRSNKFYSAIKESAKESKNNEKVYALAFVSCKI